MELHWKFANKSILFWFTFHHGNGSGCLGLQPNTVVQNYWMKNKLISIIKSNWLNQWMTFSIILYLSASCRMLQGHKKNISQTQTSRILGTYQPTTTQPTTTRPNDRRRRPAHPSATSGALFNSWTLSGADFPKISINDGNGWSKAGSPKSQSLPMTDPRDERYI